jgi:hypothetical protein
VGKFIAIIKEKYPAVAKVEEIFHPFHTIIMGAETDKLDEFIEKYRSSEIAGFCSGIERDIDPVNISKSKFRIC